MSIAKLTHYKNAPSDLLDLIDVALIADNITRCAGGRVIKDGYMCIHCGLDPSARYDSEGEVIYQRKRGQRTFRRCGDPKEKVLQTRDLSTDMYVNIMEG